MGNLKGSAESAVATTSDALLPGSSASPARQVRDALIAALRERNPELVRHQERVAFLALRTARALELDARTVQKLALAADLHDIGKLGVPDTVLDKPGSLTEEEWGLIRAHTVIGEQILAAAVAMSEVARIVRSTHERWDGRGYPDGLSGEEIPLEARVISVCDAFEVMTTGRLYAGPISVADAMDALQRGAGSQFDPSVVEAFATVLRMPGVLSSPPRGAIDGREYSPTA